MDSNMKSIRNKLDQKGVASILVAGVFVVIISLVVTSFALLMRREQRQALDKQLSTQAYYAAESGVNAAVKALDKNTSLAISDCSDTSSLGTNDLGNGLQYTCVLIDNKPGELLYSPVSTEKSTILKLNASGARTINISWEDNTNKQNYVTDANEHPLPAAASVGPLEEEVLNSGVLRLSLMPITEPITREKLREETQTLFLYPNLNNTTGQIGEHTYAKGKEGQGVFVDGQCNPANSDSDDTTYDCNIKITNLPEGVDSYYIRLKSIYTPHSVEITADNGAGNQIQLPGTQAVIDATGKANDVLRRIQVRVPLKADYSYPEFGLETTNAICKQLTLVVPINDHTRQYDIDDCAN